jgi:MYXO-CTERM domain-containing protein
MEKWGVRAGLLAVAVLALGLLSVPVVAQPTWPPPKGADLTQPANWPNDPGFIQYTIIDDVVHVLGGDWNLWSFVPKEGDPDKPGEQPNKQWQEYPGFRQSEVAIGTGMHADRAWSLTTGDRRVLIAVLDSGIKWESDDLVNKHYLNRKELPAPQEACRGPNFKAADPWDSDGDGIFNMLDYAQEGGKDIPKTSCDARVSDLNKNGLLDPQDLIKVFSDSKDDDGNGYVDDISGWDFFRNDNDAFDDTRFGHGTGEAHDSAAEGNNGRGSLGICPDCTVMAVRVGDSFVADGNDFAAAVIFATDSGANVVQEALGTMSRSHYADAAINYAYANNVVVIASAADELSFHHNMPGTTDHTVYVHAIVYDGGSPKTSTTFLNFNNCTNFGGNLVLSSPGTGCSSEATGVTSGHAGMIYSAGVQANLNPPLSAEEVRGVLIMSADDIDVPESKTDPTKFPSGPGWDLHFGYGRNNVFRSVQMVQADQIPPDVDILTPSWFEPIEVTRTPKFTVSGRIGKRSDGKAARYAEYSYVLEYAKGIDPKGGWVTVSEGKTAGIDGKIAEFDVAKAAEAIDFDAPLIDHDQYSFTLRLRATAKAKDGTEVKSEYRKSIGLYKDPDLLPGYPKHVKTSVEASPKLFDLDGDGGDELIQPTSDGFVHAWKADGSEAAGWPIPTPVRRELGDEGVQNVSKACAYRADKAGCTAQNGKLEPMYREMMLGTPAVGDLDGDGSVEVIVTTYDGHVVVAGKDGKPRAGFPVEVDRTKSQKCDPEHLWDDGIFSAAALADLDKDGKLEIVVTAMDQHVYVWRHDGTQQPGFPVLVRDPELGDTMGDRIIAAPSIGDINGDGKLEIATGTNEAIGADKAKNEARGYVLWGDGNLHEGGPFLPGFPVTTLGIMAFVLPTVGSGVPGHPALLDIDYDGKLEINFDTIGSSGTFYTSTGKVFCRTVAGTTKKQCSFDNQNFGAKSNTQDSPAYILIANASLGRVDPTGGVDFVKATAGFKFALTFASGGQRAEFDHHLSAWDTASGKMLEGWPRVIDDWQFFSNPAIVDLNNDDKPEVIAGSAGYLVRAWNYLGEEAKGFPKFTMGWVLGSPAVGDIDGDGKFDVSASTRDGWVFAWRTGGTVKGSIVEWPFHGHDLHNTANYHSIVNPYAKTADPTPTATSDATGDGGCSARSTATSTGGTLLALALLALVVLRRRQTSREG